MKKNILVLFAFCLYLTKIAALIVETPHLDSFVKAIEDIDQQTLVLFDVDETLIVPKDLILRPKAEEIWTRYAEELFAHPEKIEYFLGQIFSQIEYKMVDPEFVAIIHSLQQRNIKNIAFTNMQIGPCGVIPLMEDWRTEHLKKYNIDFSQVFPMYPEIKIEKLKSSGRSALFKQGILYANGQHKGPVLIAFLEKIGWKPTKIFFIDDRLNYLKSVEESLKGTGIEFIGFHYTEVENWPCSVDEDLVKFQIRHLSKTGEWLSDGQASELIGNLQTIR